ncbi:MAG: response regulator transcription factor [Pseudomonadota bacterium]
MSKILIAEDQALVRQGFVALLESQDYQVVEVDNGVDALRQGKTGEFDLILLDIGLPKRTGIDVLRELKKSATCSPVVVLTGDSERYAPRDIYLAGADAFLFKTTDANHFLDICQQVLAGKQFNDSDDEEISETSIAQLSQTLSERELQIVKMVVEGSSNREIGESLFISEHTVRKHREHVNKKLMLKTPVALASFAIKAGLV